MTPRRLLLLLAVLAVVAAVGAAALPRPETAEERVARITSELRCPVCQGQPVADSPSQTAREMRALVAQRVAEGRSDDEIRAEFVRAYGEWILLEPPLLDPRGLVWLLPLAAIALGALLVMTRLRAPPEAVPADDDEVARIRALTATEEAADL